MKTRSFLVQIVVLLVLGTLVAKAAVITSSPKSQGIKKENVVVNGKGPINGQSPVKGQDPVKSQDPVKGQGPLKGQDPVKGQDLIVGQERASLPFKRGTCPRVLIRCALWNPPNKCLRDAQCPGAKKCCEGFCGKTCMDPR
ncbi:elafin-like [Dama dama]|uniref:elafin-like n=1 Tax=Dama dama TaxID=30532 RepID=UPI002A3625F4|nr:elafin-like [Dama dama]